MPEAYNGVPQRHAPHCILLIPGNKLPGYLKRSPQGAFIYNYLITKKNARKGIVYGNRGLSAFGLCATHGNSVPLRYTVM